jgi:Mg/Co/Ni transporter MgtE
VIRWLGLELKAALISHKRNKVARLVSSTVYTVQCHVTIQSALDRSPAMLRNSEVLRHRYVLSYDGGLICLSLHILRTGSMLKR